MASDPTGAVYGLFASERIPRTYVISPEGTILYQTTDFFEFEIMKMFEMIDDSVLAK